MTVNEFEQLSPEEKVVVIFEAQKLTERMDDLVKVELFCFDNFYIEIKTSNLSGFKRTIKTYTLRDLPPAYARHLISVPIVVLDTK